MSASNGVCVRVCVCVCVCERETLSLIPGAPAAVHHQHRLLKKLFVSTADLFS